MSESAPGGASSDSTASTKDSSVVCPTCGRGDFKKPGDMKLHHYHTHGESIAMQTVECAWCGEPKQETAGQVNRHERFYCDNECKGKWQSSHLTGKENPHWSGGKVTVECDWCGTPREMYPSQAANADHHFCLDTNCEERWRSKNFSGERSPRFKGGYEPYYGSNWLRQRRRALKRDQYRCQSCGDNASDLPREPCVHHIIPRRRFEIPEEANSLDNLVTLCDPCHSKYEGLYIRPDTR